MKNLTLSLLLGLLAPVALAKLPAPVLDDAAKAKAEEAKAKTAWQSKVDAFQLCKAQDRAVANARKSGNGAKQAPAAAGSANGTAPTAAAGAAPAVPTPVSSPMAAVACMDPGPFAYTPPAQKPLEASGAHSPTGTAISPPSTKQPAAATPDKKS
ncbi:hypothetical protein [Ramlibacter rhizophilus]|uniref:Uncharacterized protein n=1 Tax=Ramlibacter rhizophilus TaxID=1781167 RepID=A0A4Z0BU79_9BURK|nr:hypothetical protein [Ramlibacter rhizophilus]TFZ01529.1 hypothetical protein EZ242_09170 [Ramlibacter rhizophilus]